MQRDDSCPAVVVARFHRAQRYHRRFAGNSGRVAEVIAVEDVIADHQHRQATESIQQVRDAQAGQVILRAKSAELLVAKWIGSLLSQLTPQQISDAFRAAGYSPDEVQAYSHAVVSRIEELKEL